MTGQYIPWGMALAVFIGSVPILAAIIWSLISVDKQLSAIRADLLQIRTELADIRNELTDIRKSVAALAERVATLEERDRWTHPIARP